jgi:diguanylate cyclase (GGDEF)-like protein/PAS domain S-box-containing protein
MPLIVVLLCAAATVAATLVAVANVRDDARRQQSLLAGRATGQLQVGLATIEGRMRQLAIGLQELPRVGRAGFDRNAAPLLDEPGVAGLVYIARVRAGERRAFERRAGFRILTGAPPNVAPAPPLPEYYPVTYALVLPVNLRQAGRVLFGFDVAVEPARAPTMMASRDAGAPRATAPGPIATSVNHIAVSLLAPVYRAGRPIATVAQRRAAVIGWADAVYADQGISLALRPGLPKSVGLSVDVDGQPLLRGPRTIPHAVRRRFAALGRTWTIVLGRPRTKSGLVVTTALVGALLTALLGLISLLASRRERYALRMVATRLAERDAAEASRAAIEHRLAAVFEQTPIGMALAELDGRVMRVNHALTELTGKPAAELEGRRVQELLHPGDTDVARDAVEGLRDGALRAWSGECRVLHAGGHAVWAAVGVVPVRDAAGAPEHLLASVQDVTDRRRYEERLRYLADHDPLTGLLNRRGFEQLLERQVAEAHRYGSEGALIVIDLDHFKLVNDSLGHHSGDELISRVAVALRERLRDTDRLARLGGDEFAILVPRGGEEEATRVAEAVLDVVRAERIETSSGGARPITASVGVALLGDDEVTADELMINADVAMYEAKEAGRNRFAIHRELGSHAAGTRARSTWVERLQEALASDAFELHAQPIFTVGGEIERFELLIRMRTPDGELVEPAAFLDVAERFDLIREIDRWVVGKATMILTADQGALAPIALSINLSARSVGDPALLALIEQELVGNVEPAALTFEVTETTAVADLPRAQRFAARLHELGFTVALDDFGAGFGNFFYLKHLPFDYVKIDGEFVRNATTSVTDRLVVDAVAGIARGMGKRTVAEFVTNEATLQLMREMGIDLVQGFHVGRPMPLEHWRRTNATMGATPPPGATASPAAARGSAAPG